MNSPEDPTFAGRASAFAEVALLIVGGSLAARAIADGIGLGIRDARDALLYGEQGPQWLSAAQAEAQWLVLRFGLTLLVALLICWWIGGPSRRAAGLTKGEGTFAGHVGFGLVMGVILAAPVFLGRVLNELYDFGERTPFWALMGRSVWTPGFWLYMAVSSFVLVPVVEELLFRAYALGRYRMHFSPGAAVLLNGALFWVSHGQYLRADAYLLANSALLFVSACILAWSVVRTGSILPALVAHAFVNVPMSMPFRLVVVAAAIVLILMLRRRLAASAADFFRVLAGTSEWVFLAGLVVALVGGAFLIRSYPVALTPLLSAFLLIALWGFARRAPWARRGATAPSVGRSASE